MISQPGRPTHHAYPLSLRSFKSVLFAMAVFGLASRAAFAQTAPNPVLLFTEESSTVLTATVGGSAFGTVTMDSPDHWTWLVPADRPDALASEIYDIATYWLEPESTANQTLGNWVTLGFSGQRGAIGIISDYDFKGSANPSIPNGTISLDKLVFYYVDGNSETFSVQFNDLGDKGTRVPDSTSTLGMLFLSVTMLFGVARVRTARAN